jgi:hypothetical protein
MHVFGRYPTREGRPFGEWWKNHILPQHDEERVSVAIFDGPFSWSEAFRHLLYRVKKLRNSIILQVFDYLQSGSVEDGALDCS